MKKTLLLSFAFILSIGAYAQTFQIESLFINNSGEGFVKNGEEKKDYFIKEYPNLTSQDLYKAVCIGIEKTSSIEKKTTTLENSFVTVEEPKKYLTSVNREINGLTVNVYYHLSFTITFEVKDGKVRVSKIKALTCFTDFKHVYDKEKSAPYFIASYHLKKTEEELNKAATETIRKYLTEVFKEIEAYSEW